MVQSPTSVGSIGVSKNHHQLILLYKGCFNLYSHFNHIPLLQDIVRLAGNRRKMADAIVDRHARRERDSLLQLLLLLENLAGLVRDQLIPELADLPNGTPDRTLLKDLLQDSYKTKTRLRPPPANPL